MLQRKNRIINSSIKWQIKNASNNIDVTAMCLRPASATFFQEHLETFKSKISDVTYKRPYALLWRIYLKLSMLSNKSNIVFHEKFYSGAHY